MSEQRDRIAARAYALWERRGRPLGSPEVDWIAAEREIEAQTSEPGAPKARLDAPQQKAAEALSGGSRQADSRALPGAKPDTSDAPAPSPKVRVGRNGTHNTPR